ncbi:MAG TPA: CocE/NonD family hydrolase [Bryobacteraceae bacterium]|nr:CocE/NonD family hydrolase [Bryobacteraceae bacterium]
MRAPLLAIACSAVLAAATAFRLLHVPVVMHDGTRLSANVFLPSEHRRVPTILIRTAYGKGVDLIPNYQAFVDHGYAVVVQDVRGRYESEGDFEQLHHEPEDGDATLNWIAQQSWSNGNIGMVGGSYLGIVQWKAALRNNPHLKAIFPVVSGDDDYRDRYYSRGGALKLGHRLEWMAENLRVPGYHPDFNRFVWHLPLRTADVWATGQVSEAYQEAMRHPAYDSFWRAISTREHLGQIRIPVFAVGGWYDNYVQSDLDAFVALRKTSGLNHILIGPWPHNMSYKFEGVDFGPESAVAVRGLQLHWFDQWLMGKDTEVASMAPVKVFLMGTNQWLEGREWPPEEARAKVFYLDSNGHANSREGDGRLLEGLSPRELEDSYTYAPRNPVPTRGGAVCCNPRVFPWGPLDQRDVEDRPDVLVYSTRALRSDVAVAGPVKVVLYLATSARDTDFTAKLVDVFPDGTARILTDGILRLRYRKSLERSELARPGEVYEVTIDAGETANVFLRGHRIRLEIASSNFPKFDRNPNTGGSIADETHLISATQTVYHGGARASRLELMVLPVRHDSVAAVLK